MAKKSKTAGLFDMLKQGLEDSIAYSRGELSLSTTSVPAPAPEIAPTKIVALRKRLRMSQTIFAATLNVSPKTVQSWEQGLREPNDASLRLLQIIGAEPSIVKRIVDSNTYGVLGAKVKRKPAAV